MAVAAGHHAELLMRAATMTSYQDDWFWGLGRVTAV